MHLYLIRHGQSYVNLKDWTGGMDEPLTELGQQQAEALAAWLPRFVPHVDVIYASTMHRANETAEYLARAYGMELRADTRLREIGTNQRNHEPWSAERLPNKFSDYWASERPFSNVTPVEEAGETMMHFRTRVGMWIEDTVREHEGQTVVTVCHGGVIETAFDHIFNIGPWRRAEVWTHNTAITHFEYVNHPTRESWRLHFHNRVDHLLDVEGARVARN